MKTLNDLFLDELKDIYSAERQLLKALPRMVRGANSDELRSAFQTHLSQTQVQVERLDQIFESLDESPRGKKCHGMAGLLEEGEEALDQDGEPDVLDAGLIGAAQRVEHYEIAAYGTAVAHAKSLGHSEIANLLGQTLQEEEETDRLLTQIAEGGINRMAAAGGDSEDEEETAPVATGRTSSRGRTTTAKRAGGRASSSRASR